MEQDGDESRALLVLKKCERRFLQLEAFRQRNREKLIAKLDSGSDEDLAGLLYRHRQLCSNLNVLRALMELDIECCRRFVFSSILLRDSFRLCCEHAEEGMHFVVGIQRDETLIATKIVQFPYSHREMAGAGGKHEFTHKIAIEVQEEGHMLIALIHSHPGSGPNANHNSGTDMETQRRYETGWPFVSGIWSRDGYIRFFSSELPFEIEIAGTSVRKVEGDSNVYKIAAEELAL